ncbi:MAG: endonuclease III [Puniceicoccales bacterium]|jgi:endonuclease-3|nr:endonuclease III [Puniceicoccales bacterium]
MGKPFFALSDRAALVGEMLFSAYGNGAVGGSLRHDSPFQLLVAVVLSARCRDSSVNAVTAKLFFAAPTASAVAAMDQQQLEDILHPLGFFRQKSRSLLGLSKKIVEDFSGFVPMNFADLESLPGVGHKSASVVLGLCGGIAAFPVDTHVFRLAKRWGLSGGKNIAAVERDLKMLYGKEIWMDLHLRMIAHGRLHCTARSCGENQCAICRQLRSKPWL